MLVYVLRERNLSFPARACTIFIHEKQRVVKREQKATSHVSDLTSVTSSNLLGRSPFMFTAHSQQSSSKAVNKIRSETESVKESENQSQQRSETRSLSENGLFSQIMSVRMAWYNADDVSASAMCLSA